ncbi:trypsin-like serine protease [Streptomyces sp. NPDC001941]|uniref:trypsin-like serine protease n=1 Tax=Streptomyces sp. NPDC001941 TaxID=3154659 RepID=UPI0033349F1A
MTSARHTFRKAVPAAAVAGALAGAVLTAAPAQAAGHDPRPASVGRPAPASQAELQARVDAVKAALAAKGKDTEGQGKPRTGKANPRIIGGDDATTTEAPWMVQLFYNDDRGTDDVGDDESFFCGGTLVNQSKIVTSASCVAGRDWVNHGTVVAGSTKLYDGTQGRRVGIWRTWTNPAYDDAKNTGDVAVLTLRGLLPFKGLQPTAAANTASYTPGTTGTVYGWGSPSSSSDALAPNLKKATLTVQADKACTDQYGARFTAGQMLCAGEAATGSDTGTVTPCHGDTGGPLVIGGRIAGIVSWSEKDCSTSGARGVFTKTSTFTGLINPRVDDTNLNYDDKADLFARGSDGNAYAYLSRGTSLGSRAELGDWGGANVVRQTDLNLDDDVDLLFRTADGKLYWFGYDANEEEYTDHQIGSGWGSYRNITVPGDVTGDGAPDVVATDAAGALWLWSGKGNGGLNAAKKIGVGWSTYQVYGKGDYSGDGIPDLLARDAQARLWVYKGTGNPNSPFSARVQIGSGWNFTAYVTTGDITGDGRADFIVRDAAGDMWAYRSTGSATVPFVTSQRIKVGTGWKSYNLFG